MMRADRKHASETAFAIVFVIASAEVAYAQTSPGYGGCTEGVSQLPALTPAMQSATDLRCFSVVSASVMARAPETTRTPIFPLVLTTTGVASIGLAIGLGIGGASIGNSHDEHVASVVANVALSVGITAIVTGIVLLVLPRH